MSERNDQQSEHLKDLPKDRSAAAERLLYQLGFAPMDTVQHRFTNKMYVIDYTLIGYSDDDLPLRILVYGSEVASRFESATSAYIGNICEFRSLVTGASLTAEELLTVI